MLLPSILSVFRNKAEIPEPLPEPKRILLVKQSERLGNIVLMNAGISSLKRRFPDSEIHLLLPAAYAGVMRRNGLVTSVISVEKRKYISRPWKLYQLIGMIRKQEFDMAVNCSDLNSHSSTEASYTILSGAGFTAGWKVGRGGNFDIEVERYEQVVHASRMYLELFKGIFGPLPEGDPYFNILPERKDGIGPDAGIFCGGRGSKRIPIAPLLELGSRLAGAGAKVDYILGPAEEGLRRRMGKDLGAGTRLLPSMNLELLMDRIREYAVFVSSDSGPMHLAWTLGAPTIGLFMESEIEKFRPLSPGSIAVDVRGGFSPEKILNHILGLLKMARISG